MVEVLNDLTYQIIGAAIEVHKILGPGLLESIYEESLCQELLFRKIPYERQKKLPICYKGFDLETFYRMDLIVAQEVIIEIKSIQWIEPIHEAQLLTYLKVSGLRLGLLINFNTPVLREEIRRMVLNL
ncbi:MAG: GxxExxY protein [Spirochaetes bacterium GWF1_51_8]|nr:MAG: GxxExxY protein [Spirochaetes bacterium GWF1_51_8]